MANLETPVNEEPKTNYKSQIEDALIFTGLQISEFKTNPAGKNYANLNNIQRGISSLYYLCVGLLPAHVSRENEDTINKLLEDSKRFINHKPTSTRDFFLFEQQADDLYVRLSKALIIETQIIKK